MRGAKAEDNKHSSQQKQYKHKQQTLYQIVWSIYFLPKQTINLFAGSNSAWRLAWQLAPTRALG